MKSSASSGSRSLYLYEISNSPLNPVLNKVTKTDYGYGTVIFFPSGLLPEGPDCAVTRLDPTAKERVADLALIKSSSITSPGPENTEKSNLYVHNT